MATGPGVWKVFLTIYSRTKPEAKIRIRPDRQSRCRAYSGSFPAGLLRRRRVWAPRGGVHACKHVLGLGEEDKPRV